MNFQLRYCIYFTFVNVKLKLTINSESQGKTFTSVVAVTTGLDLVDKDASWGGKRQFDHRFLPPVITLVRKTWQRLGILNSN